MTRWFRFSLSVADSFVCRCLTSWTRRPSSHPAHRTGLADCPHPALGEKSHDVAHGKLRGRLVRRARPSLSWRACSAFTHVTACMLAESPMRPSTPKASAASLPPPLLRLLPGGANQFPGGFTPAVDQRLFTAHSDHATIRPSEKAQAAVRHSARQVNVG